MNYRSKNLDAMFTAWRELVKEYETKIDSVKKDQYLSPFGRTEKIRALEAQLDNERQVAIAMWEKEWTAIKDEYIPLGTSNTADRTNAMQTIIAVGKDMTAQMLTDVLAPVKKDVSAIRLLKPVIEKQGLFEAFEHTEAYKLLNAANKVDSCVKEAEKISKAMEKETDSFKWSINKKYMLQFLEAAEKELETVRELEG